MANLFRCGGGIPSSILLNRKYGLNKEVTGDLNKYVFVGGNDYKLIAFGQKDTGYLDLNFTAINSSIVPTSYFKNKIDLTNVNSIDFTVEFTYAGIITLSVGTTTNLGIKSLSTSSSPVTNNTPKTYSLDVSELSGEYYIGFLHSSSYSTWGVVSEIILH